MRRAPDTLDITVVALFLDVDGTLLEIRDNPADVVADEELIDILETCSARLNGAMSLVSGRSIAEVDRIFAPASFPIAGAHGTEFRFDDDRTVTVADDVLPAPVVESLEGFAAKDDGLLLEYKRNGVSLRCRRAPQLADECRARVNALTPMLGDAFRVIKGKMVFEIVSATHNKGAAIETFLAQEPFAGRVPVFLGDDVTDEDGFKAVNAARGISIRVGSVRHSVAEYCLPDVADVRPWLTNAILGGEHLHRTGEHRH